MPIPFQTPDAWVKFSGPYMDAVISAKSPKKKKEVTVYYKRLKVPEYQGKFCNWLHGQMYILILARAQTRRHMLGDGDCTYS